MPDSAPRQTAGKQLPTATSRPLIIPVFIPHAGCPHRCVFCNQKPLTGAPDPVPASDEIEQRIETFLATRRTDRHPVEIAFYGGNFLGLPHRIVDRLLTVASRYATDGRVDGIRFSTRPDTVTSERLAAIAGFPVTTVELGAQSMDDGVLERSERGHDARATEKASAALKGCDMAVGIQLMIGLPGDDDAKALETARRVVHLAPDFVRLYPTLVLAGSPLAAAFSRGAYRPMSLAHAVNAAKRMYLCFLAARIPVIRMGLQETDSLSRTGAVMAGPHHPSFGEQVLSTCFGDLASGILSKMKAVPDPLVFRIHPRSESKLRGRRNATIAKLKETFDLDRIRIEPDPLLDPSALAVCGDPPVHLSTLGAPP